MAAIQSMASQLAALGLSALEGSDITRARTALSACRGQAGSHRPHREELSPPLMSERHGVEKRISDSNTKTIPLSFFIELSLVRGNGNAAFSVRVPQAKDTCNRLGGSALLEAHEAVHDGAGAVGVRGVLEFGLTGLGVAFVTALFLRRAVV
ncbi:hypothetical protein EYF80_032882 [Liparis tanakae]|uniref:Uncharacterized protein n=1 Tax=Liparis tanakae TaxID=230148 RepID=A0A4Z2GVW1_9TELE|nr:hypothetical protein EYF80_032882 [Liparis tanakae]